MGTGLEMMQHAFRLAGLGLMMLTLGACSNDASRINYAGLVQSAAPQLAAGLTGQTAAPAAAPVSSPAVVLASTTVPVALMQTEEGQRFYVLGVRDNGPYRTFATATRQTVVMRQGLVTATRGFGQDLMASDVDDTLSKLAAGREGPTRRVMQVLDGEDVTRDLVLDCVLRQGVASLPHAVVPMPAGQRMSETCNGRSPDGTPISFTNSYLVDAAGRVVLSRQWLPTLSGALTLHMLRH